ncbi:MAG: hypothetical protein R2851_08490 [Caldilineaceae bacterium]
MSKRTPPSEAPSRAAPPVTLLHLPPPAPGATGRSRETCIGCAVGGRCVRLRAHAPETFCCSSAATPPISLLARLHVAQLEVVSELLPGMPLTAPLSDGTVLHVVLKAGNHGRAETLTTLVDVLLRRS